MQVKICYRERHAEGAHGPAAIRVSPECFHRDAGGRWSLLIIRDMMLRGSRTFKEFLDSYEKSPPTFWLTVCES